MVGTQSQVQQAVLRTSCMQLACIKQARGGGRPVVCRLSKPQRSDLWKMSPSSPGVCLLPLHVHVSLRPARPLLFAEHEPTRAARGGSSVEADSCAVVHLQNGKVRKYAGG